MWDAHVIRQQKRADFKMLHMLDDRQLNDLGIGRSENKERNLWQGH